MRNERFTSLLIGDILANFGSWIDYLAILTLAAYEFHSSAYGMAGLSTAMLLPTIMLAKTAGKISDTNDSKRVLYLSIIARLCMTAAILAVHNYYIFLAIVALRSTANAFVVPAINSVMFRMSSDDVLPQRFALLNVTNNIAKIMAPTIGAAASQFLGERNVLVGSIVLSLLGVLCFVTIPRIAPKQKASSADKTPNDKPSKVKHSVTATALWPLFACVAAYSFLALLVNNQMPVLLKDLGFGKEVLGLLVSASGIGGFLGGLLLARKKVGATQRGKLREVTVPGIVSASVFICMGLILTRHFRGDVHLLCACFFATGFSGSHFAVASNVFLGKHAEGALGEATSVRQAVQSFVQLIAPVIGAFLFSYLSYASVFLLDGGVIGAVFFSILVGGVIKDRKQRSFELAR